MAPPSSRRRGYSRKAHYGLFLAYVIAIGGVLFALLLLLLATVSPNTFNGVKGTALDATAPVSAGGRSVVRVFTDAGSAVGNYFRAGSQNAQLKRELEAVRQDAVKAAALELENKELKRLLSLSQQVSDRVTTARIVGSTFQSSRRFATIWAGSGSGVAVGQPVRSPEGLIGRVLESGHFAARVLLITDGASNVPVRLLRDGTPALATGRGDGTIDIKPQEVGAQRFRRGDLFVTSGTGGIFPPNIPVAVVVVATRDDTIATPLADPAQTQFAIVERMYQPEHELSRPEAEPATP
jgi:rod shape-determining protein MreC